MPAPVLALTTGEPAGVGPDLTLQLAATASALPGRVVAIGDPQLLADRARQLGLELVLEPCDPGTALPAPRPGVLPVWPVALAAPAEPGVLDPANAGYVLETLDVAIAACRDGRAQAMVTAPLHKGVIIDGGHPGFTGHTEYLRDACGVDEVVMMLATRLAHGDGGRALRVALATTHLPLREVADAIDTEGLSRVLTILDADLKRQFGIARPRIAVCGLNPHAGEGGHLGREEIEVIAPTLARLREGGLDLVGPLPADTLFTPRHLHGIDAVLAMYHDQGLPVLKYAGFGRAANITLGLPIIRTSVDHGTALDLAGSGRADTGSLQVALSMAADMARARRA
ncbi:4-hydroxythreonine-4-phosphate dehydrogenase PdxA [Modicisalibacter tunisiensis]|uniref:4-hydroxythreonine-4-phosphate dehydrogenase n=1 Tax=Modicisalibacter tunisiensis TaxID=390637 RepID=A0ABS7WWE0_9GAMM|nr:4-hydroxythreonine-4-phosphate dehydrogenase PdxA [Modicisalibacter tunisiensis]MBZ9566489.1 4-hydroxythreonine-4-phosphate dehydrogenase PdxA [Modicisalibacter tunisiensis]